MNRIILLVVGCLLMYNMTFAQPAIYPNDRNWQLHWEDNFSFLNTDIWSVTNNFDGWGKNAYVHIPSNVYLNNDTLVLRIKKEPDEGYYCLPPVNQWWCVKQWLTKEPYQYTSGEVTSKPAYNTKYGYMEARVKMTFRPGVGYAFWTFRGIDQNYSNPAEIDIFETLVPRLQQAPNALSTCIHTCYHDSIYHNPVWNPDCKKPLAQHYYLSNFSYEDWHTYSVEWDADKITWYVDSKPIRTSVNRNLDSFGNSITDPVKILIGNGVDPERLLTNDFFEEFMYVDYVKVYQLKYDCGTVVVGIPNFATFDYKVKKSIILNSYVSFGGALPRKSFPITLRATDFIELQAGFEAPLGTELYLDINPCDNIFVVTPGGGISTDGD